MLRPGEEVSVSKGDTQKALSWWNYIEPKLIQNELENRLISSW